MPKIKNVRKAATTVLIVGEGATEKAFLDYLKSIYVVRGCGVSVTVRDAHGKSPEHIVTTAIRHSQSAAYDAIAVLLDTDVPWPDSVRKKARSKRICMIGSSPCCDGLILSILGQRVPHTSAACKQALAEYLKKPPLVKEVYEDLITIEITEARRAVCETTSKILSILEGKKTDSE